MEEGKLQSVQLGSEANLLFRTLLGSMLENAQVAALEITDGLDMARMPQMLESVHSSVGRASKLLEQLLYHASDSTNEKS